MMMKIKADRNNKQVQMFLQLLAIEIQALLAIRGSVAQPELSLPHPNLRRFGSARICWKQTTSSIVIA
jgi:hypothetical protein